jgi:hypothetical protein
MGVLDRFQTPLCLFTCPSQDYLRPSAELIAKLIGRRAGVLPKKPGEVRRVGEREFFDDFLDRLRREDEPNEASTPTGFFCSPTKR